jgi:hypothetical protein
MVANKSPNAPVANENPTATATTAWSSRPQTIRKLWWGLYAVLAVTLATELVNEHHGAFGVDGTFGFNAWYGFATCVAMVLGAKALGVLIKRADNYYVDGEGRVDGGTNGGDGD